MLTALIAGLNLSLYEIRGALLEDGAGRSVLAILVDIPELR